MFLTGVKSHYPSGLTPKQASFAKFNERDDYGTYLLAFYSVLIISLSIANLWIFLICKHTCYCKIIASLVAVADVVSAVALCNMINLYLYLNLFKSISICLFN